MIKRHLKIYRSFCSIGLKNMLAFRFDTWLSIFVATGVWSFLTVFSMYALTLRTKGVFGWSANELIILACVYNFFIGFVSFLFARNFEEFSELVNHGKLDEIFLKPVDSQFMVSLRKAHITALFRTTIGIIVTAIFLVKLHIRVDLPHIVGFVILTGVGVMLMYSVLFTINTLNIWFTRLDNINQLFYSIRTLGRYPRNAFLQAGEIVFVLVSPLVIPLSTPTRMLLGRATLYEVSELIFATIAMLCVSRIFWKFALRSYTSASG
ncbi:ABC-2 family transporter protein [Candidatus Microgenomates bacterium]|nr:ABC-2 family transporter protein [Candidatus Microgenomates bacterium]